MDIPRTRRIEAAAALCWPPAETATVEGWVLRAGGAASRRLNSAVTLGFRPGADPGAAVGSVEAWYGARGLPPCFCLTPATAPKGLDRRLEGLGYARLTPALVLARPLGGTGARAFDAEETGAEGAGAGASGIELFGRPTPSVMAALHGDIDAAPRRERAALYARIRAPHAFALARVGGEPAAAALGAVALGHVGVFALRTAPPFRGKGLALSLVRRLLAWGHGMGAGTAFLQVVEANAPARRVFAQAGFGGAYRYWYREGPNR